MSVDPAGVEAGLARAIGLHNAGRPAEAELLCLELEARHGPNPALDQLLALLCHARGDLAAARGRIDRSLDARPAHVPSLMVLAVVAQDQHDTDAAAAALERVLQQQPGHVAAAVNLGIVHLEQGRLDAALRRFGAAWRQRPETFGRIANALCSERTGAVWLDAQALKRALSAAA